MRYPRVPRGALMALIWPGTYRTSTQKKYFLGHEVAFWVMTTKFAKSFFAVPGFLMPRNTQKRNKKKIEKKEKKEKRWVGAFLRA